MNKNIKIYTKTGDKGKTSLVGGSRVSKSNIRLEAYGTVDELNSYLGLIKDHKIKKHYCEILLEIQNRLFYACSILACDKKEISIKLQKINEEDILLLENEIDSMSKSLPELKSFILPGGNTITSYCHIARCVCRRAERTISHLSNESQIDEIILKYINRLSDYLFVLARKIAQDKGSAEILLKVRK